MGIDEFISENTGKNLNQEDQRLVREFKLQEPSPTKESVVYGIYDQKTGELLYVGQTSALIRRISDYFRSRRNTCVLGLVEDDEDIDIEGGKNGNIWERTAIKYVEVSGDKSRRERIEDAIETELNPRYPSK